MTATTYRVTAGGEVMHTVTDADSRAAHADALAKALTLTASHETVTLELLTPDGWRVRTRWAVALPEDAE